MTTQQLRDDIAAAEAQLHQCREEEDVAIARLRLLGDPQFCRSCICAPKMASALLCVPHTCALRGYQRARERHDAARLSVLLARARALRERRVA